MPFCQISGWKIFGINYLRFQYCLNVHGKDDMFSCCSSANTSYTLLGGLYWETLSGLGYNGAIFTGIFTI